MSPHIDSFAAAASTILAALAGSKIGLLLAQAVPSLPEWMNWLLGPFGALIGVLLALVWMSKRLTAADAREEERRKEREADRKLTQETLISLVRDTNTTTTAAVEVMRDVRKTLEGCPGHGNKPS